MEIDPVIAKLACPRPWEPVIAEDGTRQSGYWHHLNPVFCGKYQNADEAFWTGLRSIFDRTAEELRLSFETMMQPEFEEACLKWHNRSPHFDGMAGPAFNDLLRHPRCGCPDHMPISATGTGSWRPGCHSPPHPAREHQVTFHVDLGNARSRTRGYWRQTQEMVVAAYGEMGLRLIEIAEKSKAQLQTRFASPPKNWIGLARVLQSSHCNQHLWQQLLNSFEQGAEREAKLWAHELAHSMGVGHIPGDPIQHPGIQPGGWPSKSFKGTALGRVFERYFGGEPIEPGPGPEPEPDTHTITLRSDSPIEVVEGGGDDPWRPDV